MNFSEFSKRIHGHLGSISSQGILVGSLFTAAGSKHFDPRPTPGTDDTQKKLVSGKRKLNPKMKGSFPSPIDKDSLMDFFRLKIGDASLPLIMRNFGIPETESVNKEFFIRALCIQFQNFVSEASDDVDDIVGTEYFRLLRESGAEIKSDKPYYPGDDFQIVGQYRVQDHIKNFYEKFEHQWTIKNTGTVTWENRYLEWINHADVKIKSKNKSINIPKVKPGDEVCLTVELDPRGCEGSYEAIWEMKDIIGRSCFTDKKALKVNVIVINRLNETMEAR